MQFVEMSFFAHDCNTLPSGSLKRNYEKAQLIPLNLQKVTRNISAILFGRLKLKSESYLF